MRSSLATAWRARAPVVLLFAACAPLRGPAPPAAVVAPVASAEARPLPPVPAVRGPLAVRVVYPPRDAYIAVRDSTFIFGSLGTGAARLTIGGDSVFVHPNGAFLAWLPVPRGDAAAWELVATAGADTARLSHPIRVAPARPAAVTTDSLARDSAAVAARSADSTRDAALAAAVSATEWVMLGAPPIDGDTDRTVIGRPIPGGTYKWFLLPGTVARATGRSGASVRIQLDQQLAIWVDESSVRALPAGTAAPRRTVTNVRVTPATDWVDVALPVGDRPAFAVEETATGFVLTLYDTRASTDIVRYAGDDTLVRTVTWMQETSDRVRYTITTSRAPFGYLVLWNGSALVLRVRRPPTIAAEAPLRGLVIAVDPGHPPIGATGPTGLYEAVPALAIGMELKRMLEARGATVVLTRTNDEPVALGARPIIARRANAHALVSIHLNALPDGINPFTSNGTGTYFFHPHAEPLARRVQRGMVRQMGLRDLGVYYDNLALARPTWMPAVLCEGAFLMIPEQEAALRTPEFQARYARGVADGLEAYFRALGGEAR